MAIEVECVAWTAGHAKAILQTLAIFINPSTNRIANSVLFAFAVRVLCEAIWVADIIF